MIAAAGSGALLLGAFGFELLGGLAPCKLCIWQRWPHGLAALLGLLVLLWPGRLLHVLGAALMLGSAGLGAYHTGVERGWWAGPSSCSGAGPGLSGLSGADLLSLEPGPPLVLCTDVAWQMFGLSMASYNALASLALAVLWVLAFSAAGTRR